MRKTNTTGRTKVTKLIEPTLVAATPVDEPQIPRVSKLDHVIALIRRKEGATLEELMTSTGWQAHSVRGALAGAVRKKLGVAVQSIKEGDVRVYRLGEVQS